MKKLKIKQEVRSTVDHIISEYSIGERFDVKEVMQTVNSRYSNNLTQRELGNYVRNSAYCECVSPKYQHPQIYERIVPTLCSRCGKGMVHIEGYGYRCNDCCISIKTQS